MVSDEQLSFNDKPEYYQTINPEEYMQTVFTRNQTAKNYPNNKTINELFEDQVQKTPNNIALVYNEIKLSYRELNERANRLANYLISTYQIQGDDLIALCLDRNEHQLIAILAVLKSGGAYVPLDPGYPTDRISHVLHDTNAKVLLTNNRHKLESHAHSFLAIDSKEFQDKLTAQSIQNPVLNITIFNLAYVIYTSGTTGKPKGVMIEHNSLLCFIDSMFSKISSKAGYSTLSTTNYVFDIFGLEYLLPLNKGNTVYLCDFMNIKLSDLQFGKYNIVQLTPTKLNIFLEKINLRDLTGIRRSDNTVHEIILLIGGEALTKRTLQNIRNTQKFLNGIYKVRIINVYGPTETTIWSTCYHILDESYDIYIGKAIFNTTTYILDTNLEPVAVGLLGELYIGGAGVARGYLNLPELTSERFIANPFQTESEKISGINARLYRTGDLVRYCTDGNIEFLGRNDSQVKINGFRIELGEVESKLLGIFGVKQAVVIASQYKDINAIATENKFLVGYYVADNKLDESLILAELSDILPEYMLPKILVFLKQLPINTNGKLDYRALPEPEFISVDSYVAPMNEIENCVCAIYAEILGLATVGINDELFNLSDTVSYMIGVNVDSIFKFNCSLLLF